LLDVSSEQIYFTNSATESNNIILKGKWLYYRQYVNKNKLLRIITTPIEHKSILNTLISLEAQDVNLETLFVNVNKYGEIDLSHFEKLIKKKNILLASVMSANNEIGVINPINKLAKLCKKNNVFFHTDATQAIGKVNIQWNLADSISFSGHKIHGPKGVGVLYSNDYRKILPIIDGGYQNTFISGTVNVPGIVGIGKACEILNSKQNSKDNEKIKKLRDFFLDELNKISVVKINGPTNNRLINNLNVNINDIPAEIFLNLNGVCLSTGSACNIGDHKCSYVLEEIGTDNPNCAIRFGLSKFNTKKEIIIVVKKIKHIIEELKNGQ
jgi:cysteine desulfurase